MQTLAHCYLADIHAVYKDSRHAKGRSLLVDEWGVVSTCGVGCSVVVHANGPQVVLHHEDAWQLVQRRHVQALIELTCRWQISLNIHML